MLFRSHAWVGGWLVLGAWVHALALDLSVITCGRNDGHGTDLLGDFVSRLRKTVVSLLHNFCARHAQVSSELVIVEWRPPNTTRRLGALVREWIDEDFVQRSHEFNCVLEQLPLVRIISVSDDAAEEALRSIRHQPRGGMLEWQCKNIGLRRASGDMLLVINADDMFSPSLFNFLASARQLRRDTFYLAQNVGVYFWVKPGGQPHYALYEELFKAAKDLALLDLNELLQQGRAEVVFSRHFGLCERPELFDAGIGHFSEAREFWQAYDRDHGLQLNSSARPTAGDMPRNFYDLYVGDFMLASRVAWRRINGAPLLQQSICIDWLVSCRFSALGLRQVVLVAPCYIAHQNHPHSMTLKKKRVDKQPEWNGADWNQCRTPLQPFGSERGVLRRQWGFPRTSFPETRLSMHDWTGGGDEPW